jgi:hypothetical protein
MTYSDLPSPLHLSPLSGRPYCLSTTTGRRALLAYDIDFDAWRADAVDVADGVKKAANARIVVITPEPKLAASTMAEA